MPLSTTFAAASIKGYGGGTPGPLVVNSAAGTLYSSALATKNATGTQTDGLYWLNLPTVGATLVPCLMNDSWSPGGWMMLLRGLAGSSTFYYGSSHWTSATTLNAQPTPIGTAQDAKYHTFNYSPINDLMARWPDITTNGGSLSYGGCWVWKQNISGLGYTNSTALNLFTNASRLFVQDATSYAGWNNAGAGPTYFSSQTDVHFYGINYNGGGNGTATRWGFGWNENGGGLFPNGDEGSNDVYGGIGTQGGYINASYNAGDFVSCCCDTCGMNRSARIEVYGR